MKAYVLEKYNEPLVLKEVPDPGCGDDEVLVKVLAAGVCGTDMKIFHGKLDGIIKLPHIQGHEIAGEVVKTGKNVKTLSPGDRGLVYHYLPCRDCDLCRTGKENICLNIKRAGFELDGGFAEYIAVPEYNFCSTDMDIPMSHLAVLPDAVLTSYHSIKTLGNIDASQKMVMIGLGGLGLHGVQIGRMAGASVAGVDLRPESLEEASRLGAELVINPDSGDPVADILDWTDGAGADLIIDGVGNAQTFSTALKYLKKGGKLILMGYDPLNPVPLDALGMHYNEWQILGSRLGTKQELLEVMDHIGRGKVKALVSSVIPVKEVNSIFSDALITTTIGRIVLDCSNFS